MLQILLYIAIPILAGVILLTYLRSKHFSGKVSDSIDQVKYLTENDTNTDINENNIDSLPLPIQRYLDYSLTDISKPPGYLYLEHSGLYRTNINQGWYPITGVEYFTVHSPNFVWFAELNIKDIIKIKTLEKYISGKGSIDARLYSLIALGKVEGNEADQSSLISYVSEMVLFPVSFITNNFISWEGIDENSFKAYINQNGIKAAVTFHVNEFGQIVKAESDDKYRYKTKNSWAKKYDSYMDMNGYKVPTYSESIWSNPGKEFSYAKFNITKITYNSF